MIKLWLDDMREPPSSEWIVTKTAAECIEVLRTLVVDELSLDHDLGDEACGTGYDVVLWLEEQAHTDPLFFPPMLITVHSANTVGVSKMYAGINSMRKAVANRNNA